MVMMMTMMIVMIMVGMMVMMVVTVMVATVVVVITVIMVSVGMWVGGGKGNIAVVAMGMLSVLVILTTQCILDPAPSTEPRNSEYAYSCSPTTH